VTPIDWKPTAVAGRWPSPKTSRHSLVTPIDWKPRSDAGHQPLTSMCRHSLVTPIDWKPYETNIKPDTIILKSPLAGDAY